MTIAKLNNQHYYTDKYCFSKLCIPKNTQSGTLLWTDPATYFEATHKLCPKAKMIGLLLRVDSFDISQSSSCVIESDYRISPNKAFQTVCFFENLWKTSCPNILFWFLLTIGDKDCHKYGNFF